MTYKQKIFSFVRTLTAAESARLYAKAYDRMSKYDGYQPYGYDWVTMRLTRPGWHDTLKTIALAHNANVRREI